MFIVLVSLDFLYLPFTKSLLYEFMSRLFLYLDFLIGMS